MSELHKWFYPEYEWTDEAFTFLNYVYTFITLETQISNENIIFKWYLQP